MKREAYGVRGRQLVCVVFLVDLGCGA